MEYYIFLEDGIINGAGQARQIDEGVENIEVSEDVYNAFIENPEKYIYSDGEIIENPNYEAEQAQKEKDRIGNLTMTKRVFALILKEYGISYTQLKELIATNDDAQLEWDLCSELQRNNPLLDVMGAKLGVTPEQLDEMFKYANGEITELVTGA